ncbi:MAG TPA: o-succinylbenzoate synthase [Candidatus Lustribacter sp.]|nr:o-succinylbenzoate synthase [Candidatus Lustribacter sp.]
MRLEGVELLTVHIPLVAPFRTSFGTEHVHETMLVHAITDSGEGWGECVAGSTPAYSSEYLLSAADVMRRFLAPALFRLGHDLTAEGVGPALGWVKGHRMAKAGLESAILDAQLRAAGQSLASYLGAVRDRVPAGVSVGIMDSLDELMTAVGGYLDQGYRRIKLKIEPGWDLVPAGLVRHEFGPDLPLQVDANTAYTRDDAEHLGRLDELGLLLIEQPLDEEDIIGHAQLAARVRTPICLDESIVSARSAADAIELGATSVVNIKPGRVGGYLEAVRIHDVCQDRGVPVWCGGMLETGIGRAANLALAALPNFTLPGDTSASDRYFHEDLAGPFVLEDGQVAVPQGPGIGVQPIAGALDRYTVSREWMSR